MGANKESSYWKRKRNQMEYIGFATWRTPAWISMAPEVERRASIRGALTHPASAPNATYIEIIQRINKIWDQISHQNSGPHSRDH